MHAMREGQKRCLTIDTGASAITVLLLPRCSVADACTAAVDSLAVCSAPHKRRRIRTLARQTASLTPWATARSCGPCILRTAMRLMRRRRRHGRRLDARRLLFRIRVREGGLVPGLCARGRWQQQPRWRRSGGGMRGGRAVGCRAVQAAARGAVCGRGRERGCRPVGPAVALRGCCFNF